MPLKSAAYTTEILRAEMERQRNTAEIQVNSEIISELTGNDAKIKYSKKLEYVTLTLSTATAFSLSSSAI